MMNYIFLIFIIVCGVSDFKTRIIPNKITIPFGILFLLYQASQGNITSSLLGLLIGFGIGVICFASQGMGGGDVKLMAAIGAYLGAYSFLTVLFLASILSLVWGAAQFLKNKVSITTNEPVNKPRLSIPFGTCLSIAAVNIYCYPISL